MSIKLESLSVAGLEKLIQDAQEVIERKKSQDAKLANARAEIERIAREAGVNVSDLIAQVSKGAAKTAGTRKPVAAKYRNSSDESQTWSGRGKRPRWLADALATGAVLDSFLI
jgi:DNA-binding protein H-NS